MLDVLPLYLYLAALMVLSFVVWSVLSSEYQKNGNRQAAIEEGNFLGPPSTSSTHLGAGKYTKEHAVITSASLQQNPYLQQNTLDQRKPSTAKLITDFLPSRRGSIASPSTNTPLSSTSLGELPITNRTQEEIQSFGDFPDYAALSGVRLPHVYTEFDIEKALPRPYRPFRWAYHQTMAFWKMEPDWWLELENTYTERIRQRKELFALHGKTILDSLPGSEAACKEVMEMALQFLVARYPQHFSLVRTTSGKGPDLFINKILDKRFSLNEMHPLIVLLENVPEDFAITIPDPKSAGQYRLCAGVICSAIGWTLGTKLGMTLAEIHSPVPDFKEKLKLSLDRFFTKLLPSAPIQRGSWGFEFGKPLFAPPGDNHGLHKLSQDPALTLDEISLRVDWQTLRRLPLSGAIAFNFKAIFTPVSELRDEPGIPQIAAKVLREGKRNLMDYKNQWHLEHVLLPALDKWSEEQVKEGLIDKDWEVTTLEDSPWFKGWREKWKRQQGF